MVVLRLGAVRLPMHEGREAVIGRGDTADLAIPEDPFVSNAHCAIKVGLRSIDVRDLKSTNGTSVVTEAGDIVDITPSWSAMLDRSSRPHRIYIGQSYVAVEYGGSARTDTGTMVVPQQTSPRTDRGVSNQPGASMSLSELAGVFPEAAAVMARRRLEEMLLKRWGNERERTELFSLIERAKESKVPFRYINMMHRVRIAGNEAAHAHGVTSCAVADEAAAAIDEITRFMDKRR